MGISGNNVPHGRDASTCSIWLYRAVVTSRAKMGSCRKPFLSPSEAGRQQVVQVVHCSLALLPTKNAPSSCLASLRLDQGILPATGYFGICCDLLGITWPAESKGSKCNGDHVLVTCRCCTMEGLCHLEAWLFFSGECIYQETRWQQCHLQMLRVLILKEKIILNFHVPLSPSKPVFLCNGWC